MRVQKVRISTFLLKSSQRIAKQGDQGSTHITDFVAGDVMLILTMSFGEVMKVKHNRAWTRRQSPTKPFRASLELHSFPQ